MKRFISALVVVISVISMAQIAEARDRYSDHRHHNRSGAIITGAIIGTALGVVVANQPRYYAQPRYQYAPPQQRHYYNEIDAARQEGYEGARQRYEQEELYRQEQMRRDAIDRARQQGERDFYNRMQSDRYRW